MQIRLPIGVLAAAIFAAGSIAMLGSTPAVADQDTHARPPHRHAAPGANPYGANGYWSNGGWHSRHIANPGRYKGHHHPAHPVHPAHPKHPTHPDRDRH